MLTLRGRGKVAVAVRLLRLSAPRQASSSEGLAASTQFEVRCLSARRELELQATPFSTELPFCCSSRGKSSLDVEAYGLDIAP